MKALDTGHRYLLDDLESDSKTEIHFNKDARLHDGEGYAGPTCQEYLRAIIDRVQSLNREKADPENDLIIFHGRMMIACFEARALRRHVEKEGLAIERLPLASDGHILLPVSREMPDNA